MSILPIIYTQRNTETSSTGLVALLPFRWVREHKIASYATLLNDNSTSLPIWWWPWKPVTAQQLSQLVSRADRDQPESHTDDEIIKNKTSSFNLEGGRMALEVNTFWRPDSIRFYFYSDSPFHRLQEKLLSFPLPCQRLIHFHLFLFLSLPISSNSPYFPLSIPPSFNTYPFLVPLQSYSLSLLVWDSEKKPKRINNFLNNNYNNSSSNNSSRTPTPLIHTSDKYAFE